MPRLELLLRLSLVRVELLRIADASDDEIIKRLANHLVLALEREAVRADAEP